MPKTTKRWDHRQNIGGVFSDRTNSDRAIQAFHDLGVKEQDIEEVVSLNDTVRNGKILVMVHNVNHPAPIIDIFDANKAEYNPDGSYNFRDDVAGLNVGTLAGAAMGERQALRKVAHLAQLSQGQLVPQLAQSWARWSEAGSEQSSARSWNIENIPPPIAV